jgi:hypothetical protein
MAVRAPEFDAVASPKPLGGPSNAGQSSTVTRNDPLIQFVLNAPKATEPMSPEGHRALEKYLRTNGAP